MNLQSESISNIIANAELKASDLKSIAGLSYRQLNDWDSKGIFPDKREGDAGWRKFTIEEVITLSICQELRRQFSLPLKQIRDISRWLLGKDKSLLQDVIVNVLKKWSQKWKSEKKIAHLLELQGDLFKQALNNPRDLYMIKTNLVDEILIKSISPIKQGLMLVWLGFPIYLFLQKDAALMEESHLMTVIGRRELQNAFIICPLNRIFNEAMIKLKIQPYKAGNNSGSFLDYWDKINRDKLSQREREVIHLIRKLNYQRIIVHVKGREIIRADIEEELPETERANIGKAILGMLGSKGYQTVMLTEQDGKVVGMSRKETKKFA